METPRLKALFKYTKSVRVAVITDIQGNAVALEHALLHMHRQGIDEVVCLGDVASGPEPGAVLRALRVHNCRTVLGNMDAVILEPNVYRGVDEAERRYAEMDRWCHAQLSEADKAFMRSFEPTVSVELGDKVTLLGCHGSPLSFDDVIEVTTSEDKLAQFFRGVTAQFLATGHMHNPMLRRYRDATLFNPGSIGLPSPPVRSGKRPLVASYMVVHRERGATDLTFYNVPYSPKAFKERVLSSGMPHTAWFLRAWKLD